MNLDDKATGGNIIQVEDDKGQIQQVSGGFGDSNTMDEAAL